jgi:hypothetical protein
VLAALVVLELVDDGVRRWFIDHPFTTATISGLLLLLITVLIVNRVSRIRQLRERSLVTAAQAATIARQAKRTYDALADLLEPDREGDREHASDEVRTYMGMLLISAPVLIDAKQSRTFLEQAQGLGALMSSALSETADGTPLSSALNRRVEDAVQRVKDTSQPLLDTLTAAQRTAVGDDPGDDASPAPES